VGAALDFAFHGLEILFEGLDVLLLDVAAGTTVDLQGFDVWFCSVGKFDIGEVFGDLDEVLAETMQVFM
jgi:hypothetical protein